VAKGAAMEEIDWPGIMIIGLLAAAAVVLLAI
jgi:hypothetical protein